MKVLKIIVGIVVIVAVIWLLASNFSSKKDSATAQKEPVKIGGALLLTGPAALLGELQQKAINMAIDDANKDGGVNGRPIEMVIEDAGYDPKTAVSAYQALKLKGLHLFLIDGSPVVAATHKLVTDDNNFSIAGVATAPSYFDGDNRTCRISMTSKNFGPGLADLMMKHNYKKAAVFATDNEYGKGLSEEFAKALQAKGGSVAIIEFYPAAGTADFRTSLTKIKALQSSYDVVVLSNPLASLEPMLTQMKSLGLTKPIISDQPTMDNPALKDFSLVEGISFVNYNYSRFDRDTDSAATKAFKSAYRARYNSDPIVFSAATYDAITVLIKAIRAVGEDPKKVADYVSAIQNYEGISGTFSFNNDCEVTRQPVFDVMKGGKVEALK